MGGGLLAIHYFGKSCFMKGLDFPEFGVVIFCS